MYEKAIVDKDEFEKGYYDVLKDITENGQQYYYAGIPLLITKGIVYVVEKLGAVFIVKLVQQFMEDERILTARVLCGTKNLLVFEVFDDYAEVSLYVGNADNGPMVTAKIENRPDLPKVRVPMFMGNDVLYLFDED